MEITDLITKFRTKITDDGLGHLNSDWYTGPEFRTRIPDQNSGPWKFQAGTQTDGYKNGAGQFGTDSPYHEPGQLSVPLILHKIRTFKPYNEPDLLSYGPMAPIRGPNFGSMLNQFYSALFKVLKNSEIFEVLKYLDVLTSWELLERVFYE